MKHIYGIFCLVCSVAAFSQIRDAIPNVRPEFLDQLLEENRYDEFNYYMGIDIPNLSRPSEEPLDNPMFNKDLFQGDILLPREGKELSRQALNFTKFGRNRWPGRYPIIDYVISDQFSGGERKTIDSAIQHWNAKVSNVKFRQNSTAKDYILIQKGKGCWSIIGRKGGQQALSLGDGCVRRSTILHELIHAIGINHEHCRSDRDNFVRVLWDNIDDAWKPAYEKQNTEDYKLLGSYDYYSLMHYGIYSPGTTKLALEIKDGSIDKSKIGKGYDFTEKDLQKITLLYS